MADAILLLQLEHQKMAEVLAVFARELEALEAGAQPDVALLESGLDYLIGYSDKCHHPKEELIYRKIRSRDRASATSLIDLEKEHAELRRLTNELCAVVDMCRLPNRVKNEHLAVALDQYLDYYRHHMGMEEKHLFRLAPRVLTEDDWAEIDFSLFDMADPLFKRDIEERFTLLRESLKQMASDHEGIAELQGAPDKASESCPAGKVLRSVSRLNSLQDFNALAEVKGVGGQLSRYPNNCYGLSLDHGDVVVDVPATNERAAVWCAYYFLRGRESAR